MSVFEFNVTVAADLTALEAKVASLQEKIEQILNASEAEKAEVAAAIKALSDEVAALKAAVAAGEADKAAVEAGLDLIQTAVENIFTPPAAS